jgi:hypothetical protein
MGVVAARVGSPGSQSQKKRVTTHNTPDANPHAPTLPGCQTLACPTAPSLQAPSLPTSTSHAASNWYAPAAVMVRPMRMLTSAHGSLLGSRFRKAPPKLHGGRVAGGWRGVAPQVGRRKA